VLDDFLIGFESQSGRCLSLLSAELAIDLGARQNTVVYVKGRGIA